MHTTERTVLIIYDVADNKRRRKAVKILNSYGNRVQESAFECELTPAAQVNIILQLRRVLSETEDNLRIYLLNAENKIIYYGKQYEEPEDEDFGFVG